MQYNRKMINGVVFLEEQADYLLLLGKEGLYTVQAENDHWNVHYTLPGDTSNLDKRIMFLKRQIDSQNVRKKKKHRLQKQRKQEKNSRIRNRKQRNMIWNFNTKHENR